MVLSANYAHIRGHDKFTELQDLHDLTSENLTLHQTMARGEGGKGDGGGKDASGCCLFWCPPCAVCANEGKYQYF